MTKDERAALRALAEKARDAQPNAPRLWMADDRLGSFYNSAHPSAVLALLDALDAAERRAEEARATALEEAAEVVDCMCATRADTLNAVDAGGPNCAERWRFCRSETCGAIDAAAIRALATQEPGA